MYVAAGCCHTYTKSALAAPRAVTVVIGEDRTCFGGRDINFKFTGFQLSGQV